MEKAYQRQYFENDKSPELNSDNLNKIDAALEEIDNRILQMHTRVFSAILALSNEPERISAENDRVVAENDRVVAEMEREEQIRLFVEAYTSAIDKIYEDFAPVANLLTTEKGKALDATMGKELNNKITALQENGAGNDYYVGTCSTSASTAAKVVTISNFKLKVGAIVHVKFSDINTSSAATLNVSSTGAKAMYYMNGDRMYYIQTGLYHSFIYDGTYWRYIGTLNAIISDRSYERYGVKMSGNSLIPINSGYRPTIGTSSNKFGYIHSDGLNTGEVSANSVVSGSVKTKVSGSEVELLPPYPLMKGHFLAPSKHSITLDSDVTSKYVKSYYTGFIQNGAGANGSGCALTCTAYATYDGVLKLRIIGYETTQSGYLYPFSEDIVLSTSQNYDSSYEGCPGQTTAYKEVTLKGGSTIHVYVTGFYTGECGYISGSPTITFTSWSNMVHFLEIDLMP